ncbi:carboxymuconolactone decarboxylase family protein [Aspergillus fijiensis CBS 313.89]|uniref:Uncharacterized protein n=1 Tax=Aspergillus fijiensis CBS 313.89 TaxID=1448319 RepID=A0A8G1RNZ3_9EURO|nr:uncharacterized protein BO72DRAFT_498223 [Aspergillus fijiensis CBS 313.89]RAK75295.1 hypothetical protein BO72DRAFT_498223 [Aspergillus fijiensis CBS 313.89]
MSRLPYPDYHTPHAKSHPTLNITKLLSHSATIVDHWTALGNVQFKDLFLADREGELVIMLTTANFQSTYEWTHHVLVALKAGVTRAQHPEAWFSPRDIVLLTFVETITQQPEVGDELWERVRQEFSGREVVQIISLQVRLFRVR